MNIQLTPKQEFNTLIHQFIENQTFTRSAGIDTLPPTIKIKTIMAKKKEYYASDEALLAELHATLQAERERNKATREPSTVDSEPIKINILGFEGEPSASATKVTEPIKTAKTDMTNKTTEMAETAEMTVPAEQNIPKATRISAKMRKASREEFATRWLAKVKPEKSSPISIDTQLIEMARTICARSGIFNACPTWLFHHILKESLAGMLEESENW